jgi:sugar phosphate isomerase/epimerase
LSAPIAVQLYTLREEVATQGMRAVLERVAELGYAGVELAGFGDLDAAEIARILDGTGMRAASAHIGMPDAPNVRELIDTHLEVGAERMVFPYIGPDGFADRESIARSAASLNSAASVAREAGTTVGYHNHFWELNHVDGEPALARFYAETDPDVFAEIDIYWAQVGKVDPASFVAGLGDRVQLLHVKDGPADQYESPMVAVGQGAVDVPAVLAAAPAAEWHIVELDQCATDMFGAVAESYDYLVGRGLSTPRPGR